MLFFVANDGTIIKGLPSPVYQGAANTNTIYLIAPFATNTAVTVAFRLPNGVVTAPAAMTAQQALQGIVNAETGQTYAGWTYDLPNSVTTAYGTVTAQFFFYSAQAGVITATSSTSFEVGRGVPAVLPSTPDEDVYEEILSNLAALQTQLNNGTFAARSIYAWNSTYTYGANEITFYPNIGEFGAFVKSVQTGNTGNAPYVSGDINSAWWKEVVNFNTITEDFFNDIKEAQQAAEAAQTAAEAAQTAAETAEDNAKASETAAQGYASASSESAGQAANSAEQAASSATAAAGSATAAGQSADRAQQIVDGIGDVYTPVGSIPYAQLPATPSQAERGYVYNITDSFTTDSRFVEGAGIQCAAGTNVAVVLNGSQYMYDVLGGMVDLSNYAQINGTYPNMSVGEASEISPAQEYTGSETDNAWYSIMNIPYEAGYTVNGTYLITATLNSGAGIPETFTGEAYKENTCFGILQIICIGEAEAADGWANKQIYYVGGNIPDGRLCFYENASHDITVAMQGTSPKISIRRLAESAGIHPTFPVVAAVTLPDEVESIGNGLPFVPPGKKMMRSASTFELSGGNVGAVTLGDSYFGTEADYPHPGDFLVDETGSVAILLQEIGGTPEHVVYVLGKNIPYYILPPDGLGERDMNTALYNQLNTVRQVGLDSFSDITVGNSLQLQRANFLGYIDSTKALLFYAYSGADLCFCVGNIESVSSSNITVYPVTVINLVPVKSVNGQTGDVVIETGGGTDPEAVKYTPQTLTAEQQTQARENISAANTSGMYPNLTVGKATNADNATNAANATKATQDASGNVITSTYATKSELSSGLSGKANTSGSYPNLTVGKATNADNATNATNAANATKATQDASGNVITSTYATKNELNSGLSGKANTSGSYPNLIVGKATNADNATKAQQDGAGNNIAETYATKAGVNSLSMAPNTGNVGIRVNISVPASNGFIEGSAIPYNGWLVFNCHTTATQYLGIRCVDSSGTDVYDQLPYTIMQGAGYPIFFFPVKAGQRLKITYNIAELLTIFLIPGQQLS